MKILKLYENKNFNELKIELFNLYKELFILKSKLYSNKLKETHLIKLCKKKICLIKKKMKI